MYRQVGASSWTSLAGISTMRHAFHQEGGLHMRKTTGRLGAYGVLMTAGLVLDSVVPGIANAESLNVKPGAWEITTTTMTSGSKVSPELSTRLTPAQRAKMEQALKARDGKPMTTQSCLTKEDVSHDRIIKEMEDEDDEGDAKCTIKVISKSPSKLVVDQMCLGPSPSTTHMTIEAKTTESFVAIGDGERAGLSKVRMEIKGKWLGAGCEGIEE